MSDSLASLPWSNNSDRKPMISRRDFTKVASVAAGRTVLLRMRDNLSHACYVASAPTLQCAPSESTNCASTPPKSCFLGGMLNSTSLALMSR